jgi:hypothetical protein
MLIGDLEYVQRTERKTKYELKINNCARCGHGMVTGIDLPKGFYIRLCG